MRNYVLVNCVLELVIDQLWAGTRNDAARNQKPQVTALFCDGKDNPHGRDGPSDLPRSKGSAVVRLSKSEWAVLGVILVYSFIPAFGGLIRVLELAGGPQIAPENPRALLAPFPISLHILSSFLFCIVGALLFLPSIRCQRPAAHRVIGLVIAMAGCVSALSGLWMTHYFAFPEGLQGAELYWARMVLGTAMIGFIIWAVIAIRSRNTFQHSRAMLRAYAIGQGASTQTVLGIAWIIVVGSEVMGPLRDGLMIFAWVLNLLVAEILIRKILRPAKPQHQKWSLPALSPSTTKNET